MQNWKKNTAIFIACQAISLFGSTIVMFSIFWHITLTTHSGFYTMLYVIFGILPTFFLSPLGGVWADKHNRKYLIILADSVIAVATVALALLFIAGFEYLWLIFCVAAIRALGGAVQMPAVNAMIPDMVPHDQLTRVNGINNTVQAIINLASPMVAGVLMSFIPIKYIFFVDTGTALIAISVMLFFFTVPARNAPVSNKGFLDDIKAGMGYIASHKHIRTLFIFFAVLAFIWAAPAFLSPLQVARAYGSDVWRLTAIEIAFASGMIIGGAIMATWGGWKNRIKTMAVSCVVMGVCGVSLGLGIPFWLYLTMMTLWGIMMPWMNTAFTVFIQENTDKQFMGRVFSVVVMITSSMMPMGMLLYGPLADKMAIEWLMLVSGIVIAMVSVLLNITMRGTHEK